MAAQPAGVSATPPSLVTSANLLSNEAQRKGTGEAMICKTRGGCNLPRPWEFAGSCQDFYFSNQSQVLTAGPELPAASPSEDRVTQPLCAHSSVQKSGQNKPFCSACEKGQPAPSSAIRSRSCHSTCY